MMDNNLSLISRVAPAKINLFLHVIGRRCDGFHLLDSLIVFADYGDYLEISQSEEIELAVHGPFSRDLPNNENNLVFRAAHLLVEAFDIKAGVTIRLKKNLPVASGIGGGSADAAACLTLLRDFWNINCDDEAITRIASRLGSDVPACLAGSAIRMENVGNSVQTVSGVPRFWAILVNPGVKLLTSEVFGNFGRDYKEETSISSYHYSFSNFIDYLSSLNNDLEHVACALQPSIRDVLESLTRLEGCVLARMSGSGATCFGIFSDLNAAKTGVELLSGQNRNWWIKEVRLMGSREIG